MLYGWVVESFVPLKKCHERVSAALSESITADIHRLEIYTVCGYRWNLLLSRRDEKEEEEDACRILEVLEEEQKLWYGCRQRARAGTEV